MVYIYKKNVGGKSYYYLRASERKGKRVLTKDIAYLGSSIKEAKNAIKNIPKYKDKIKEAHKTINRFLESNYFLEKARSLKLKKDSFLKEKLEDVESCKIHYTSIFNKRDELTKKETLKNFIVDFAFNTTSIEGNTITLREARDLLENKSTPKNKTLREIYDLQNTENVFFNIMKSKKEINHEFVIDIHIKLMKKIDSRAGYRKLDVKVLKSNFSPTPHPYIKSDMNILFKWYKKNKKKLHPLVLASMFHHKFEKIHPFMDGNGRTGRILLNYILIKNKYPPIVVHKKLKHEYLDALQKADKSIITENKEKHYSKLVRFMADEMSNYYWDIFL